MAERGTLFGNRGGCFHTEKKELRSGRQWVGKRWITCVLEFKGRRRELMAPGLYTELFFLDEATAFAAGHRPCMECRRPDALRFVEAWSRAHLPPGQPLKTVNHIDEIAHGERVDAATGLRRTTQVTLSTLPDGVMLTLDEQSEQPLLLWRNRLHPWSFGGYGAPLRLPPDRGVTMLTPPSFAITFAAGYEPAVHESVK